MKAKKQENHNKLITDQFTKQAIPFANVPGHSSEETMKLLMRMAGVNNRDIVLDMACGPGLVACALAPHVNKVVGIDLVPAMIEKARKTQQEKGLSNIDWKVGDILPLPFADSSFSVVVCRYAFHHFLKPEVVLKEMIRVAKSGARVAIVDVFTSCEAQSDRYDEVEKLKDPSHVRTWPLAKLQAMAVRAGLINSKAEFYRVEIGLEENLKASFPEKEGDIDKVRQAVIADIGKDEVGMGACRKGDTVYLNYPIVVIVGEKPD